MIDIEKDIKDYEETLRRALAQFEGARVMVIKIEGILEYLRGQKKEEEKKEEEKDA